MASFDFGSVLPSVGFGLSMFNTGTSTMGAYQSALANNYAAEFTATTKGYQADLAAKKADIFRQLGETEREETLSQYRALREEQRAAYGASGVDVNSGSPLQVTAHTAATGVYEAQKAQYQRNLQAWEMDNTASGLQMEAAFTRASKQNPWLSASSAAIGGLTSAFNTYGSWNNLFTKKGS